MSRQSWIVLVDPFAYVLWQRESNGYGQDNSNAKAEDIGREGCFGQFKLISIFLPWSWTAIFLFALIFFLFLVCYQSLSSTSGQVDQVNNNLGTGMSEVGIAHSSFLAFEFKYIFLMLLLMP